MGWSLDQAKGFVSRIKTRSEGLSSEFLPSVLEAPRVSGEKNPLEPGCSGHSRRICPFWSRELCIFGAISGTDVERAVCCVARTWSATSRGSVAIIVYHSGLFYFRPPRNHPVLKGTCVCTYTQHEHVFRIKRIVVCTKHRS